MKAKKIWANLAVSDLERTTKFYTDLGFKSNGNNKELTSFFMGDDDFVIHFFTKGSLQSTINGELVNPKRGNEVVFTLSAENKNDVDEWAKIAKQAGGVIFAETTPFKKGFFCGFSDPDGHKFNVLYWPK